jgi:hypothetical protein
MDLPLSTRQYVTQITACSAINCQIGLRGMRRPSACTLPSENGAFGTFREQLAGKITPISSRRERGFGGRNWPGSLLRVHPAGANRFLQRERQVMAHRDGRWRA